ncbi:MAG: chaperone modulator CbpM [Cardiobacteriaceae bacterium]|nr:chaperone modulator CbpM [Cardiobacteriaceae bacterium]
MNDITLTFQQIVHACGNDRGWVIRILEENIIELDAAPEDMQYSEQHLARLRRAHRIHRDFDASAPATALILDLLDELRTLRKTAQPPHVDDI